MPLSNRIHLEGYVPLSLEKGPHLPDPPSSLDTFMIWTRLRSETKGVFVDGKYAQARDLGPTMVEMAHWLATRSLIEGKKPNSWLNPMTQWYVSSDHASGW